MGYYYGIYVTGVIITYLLLHKRIHMLRQTSGKVSFWSAALLGLVTPFVFERSQLLTASLIYIAVAAILAGVLSRSSASNLKTIADSALNKSDVDNLSSETVAHQPTKTIVQPPSRTVEQQPNELADQRQSETIVQQPNEMADQQLAATAAQQPSETLDLQPVNAIEQVFEELLQLKTAHQYDHAIQLADKLQKAANVPTHIRQLMTMELADFYLEKLEYVKALEQLQYISTLGELSEDVREYICIQTEAIESMMKQPS